MSVAALRKQLSIRLPRALKKGGFLLVLCALFSGFSPCFAAPAAPEYQVKGAFLFNFLKFVEWPADAAGSPTTICIGILGRDPFDGALDAIKGKYARGRRVVVARFRSIEEVRGCDLLFVSSSEKGRIPQILRQARVSHMLTVADQDGFCEAGGMINLVSIKNRVGFEINLGAANRARLKISSQLLKLAHHVLD